MSLAFLADEGRPKFTASEDGEDSGGLDSLKPTKLPKLLGAFGQSEASFAETLAGFPTGLLDCVFPLCNRRSSILE